MFQNINRLFVISSKNGDNDLKRDSFDQCNMPLVEIKISTINHFLTNKEKNTNIPQQINSAGKLEEEDGARMFLLLKSSKNQFYIFL